MRRVDFAPRTIADLEDITSYGRRHFGHAKARSYVFDIRALCERLAKDELKGRPQSGAVISEFLKYRSGSHFVFYLLFERQLVVVRVLHASMNHDDHL